MQQVLAELAALRQACHQNKQHCDSGSCHEASWFEDGAQNGHAHDAWQGADSDTDPSGVNQNWGFSQLSKEDQVRASLILQLPSPKICHTVNITSISNDICCCHRVPHPASVFNVVSLVAAGPVASQLKGCADSGVCGVGVIK